MINMYPDVRLCGNAVSVFCLLTTLLFCAKGTGEKNCNNLGTLFYEDIGCKPVVPEGSDCPVKYDCGNFTTNLDSCLLRGQIFTAQERVHDDITYPSCKVGCTCNGGGEFTCAILDCPEWLGSPVSPGCYRKYEVDKCCSVGQICPQSKQQEATCTVDNKTVREGEKFYPKGMCSQCVCPPSFNGKIEEPHCKRTICNVQIKGSAELEKNCAPYYFNYADETDTTLCCPLGWVCPAENDKIIKINDGQQNSDLTCKFGSKTVKLGEGLEKEFDFHGTIKSAKCECILPPLLTCK